jgi:DNA-binding transcriptional LysR family regulator
MGIPSKTLFSRLRFRQLEMICALADCRSMRAASELMHQCPPALSKSLREVERIVGEPLFERSSRGLATSAAGDHFVREARSVLNQLGRLRETFDNRASRRPAQLTIGSAASLAWCIVPGAVRSLAEDGRLPQIRLREGRIVPLAEQLLMGDLDAIVTLATPEAMEVLSDGTLAFDQFHHERMVVVAAASHPVGRRKVTWKTLRQIPWILPPPSFIQRRTVQQAFLGAGELPPEPAIESINMPAMLRLAEAGLGLTAVPYYAVRREIDAGVLRLVKTETELESVPIGFAYRRSASNVEQLYLFRDAVHAQITRVDRVSKGFHASQNLPS